MEQKIKFEEIWEKVENAKSIFSSRLIVCVKWKHSPRSVVWDTSLPFRQSLQDNMRGRDEDKYRNYTSINMKLNTKIY